MTKKCASMPPEVQLVDLLLEFQHPLVQPLVNELPIVKMFEQMGVQYPSFWLRLRKRTDFLKHHLRLETKISGDIDIIGGPLVDGVPTDYMIGIEVKRFKYKDSNLIAPYSFGLEQTFGYTLLGFNKVMLCHFLVVEDDPMHNQFADPLLNNIDYTLDGVSKIRNMGIKIKPKAPCGCCIAWWSPAPRKTLLTSGGMPGCEIIQPPMNNTVAIDGSSKNVRNALLERIAGEIKEKLKKDSSLPLIIFSKDIRKYKLRLAQ